MYQCGYFPVEFDLKNKSYSFGKFQEFDKGFDIYATQTFADEAGRRILIGWMGIRMQIMIMMQRLHMTGSMHLPCQENWNGKMERSYSIH